MACVVLLAAWMGNADGGYSPRHWVPPALILSALVLLISITGLFVGTRLRWSALALGLFTAYAAWTFASMLWSPNEGDAWLGAGQTLLYLLAFWASVALVTLGASRRWTMAAAALGPAFIAVFTLSGLELRLEDLFENYRLIGSVGYHNGEAAFLLTSFWVAIYLGGSRRVNPLLRAAVLATAVLSADLAILTQSRGAMVAMAASLLVFFLFSGQRLRGLLSLLPVIAAVYVAFPGLNGVYLALLQEGNPAVALERVLPLVWLTASGAGFYGLLWGLLDRRWRPSRSVGRAAGGVALVGVMVLLIAGSTVFVERNGNPVVLAQHKWEAFKTDEVTGLEQSRYLSASGSGRFTLWEAAWKDFVGHPVRGVGTQNYEATYYQLRDQDVGSVRQPHMLPLEVLGERGVVGGVLFFGFLGTCVGVSLWWRFRNLSSEGKAQVGALLAAVTFWFVHSSAEWFWQLPAITLPAFVYLALLVSPWRRGELSSSGPPRWMLRTAGVGVVTLALAVTVPLYVADRYLERSYAATDPTGALTAVERAQAFNPLDSRLQEREAELAMDTGDWSRAERAYEKAIRLNPEHYAPYMYMATFHERRGALEKALLYYRKALALNPLDEELERTVSRLDEAISG